MTEKTSEEKRALQSSDQIDWKAEASKQWNSMACGQQGDGERDREYFLSVERYRYETYAPWMKQRIGFESYGGKSVLELGYGQGTDLCQFAAAGADCTGVDITQNHYELAQKNFELRGLKANLSLSDAADLHFPDSSFDVVYSFGVLHHTPDTEQCVAEAHRVLKPGGEFILAMYYRCSAHFILNILLKDGLFRGKIWELGYAGLLSTIERGADGIHTKPFVRLYSKGQMRKLLRDFSSVSIEVCDLKSYHMPLFNRVIPSRFRKSLEPYLGWYVMARAVK